jgi:elongation factor Tu
MSEIKIVLAHIVLLSHGQGGRRSEIASGYRPAFYIGDSQSDGAIYFTDREWLAPGEECEARIAFLHPEAFGERLRAGGSFEFREGLKVTGSGTVLAV